MKHILLILLTTLIALSQTNTAVAQGAKIEFDIANYPSDTLLLGYYFGDKTLVLDTLVSTNKGKFVYNSDSLLSSGVYLALYQPSNNYFQFMVNQADQKFSLKGDYNGTALKAKGSQDNEIFNEYMQFISSKSEARKTLQESYDQLNAEGKDISKVNLKLAKLDQSVQEEQMRIITENPDKMVSKLLKSNIAVDIPDFQGSNGEIQMKRYLYYKTHYFDNIDLGDPAIMFTPFINDRVTYYLEKLTPLHPDSIFESIKYLLNKMEPATETYQFYTSTFLNKYANSKIIGYDAIYVKMVDQFYSQGKTPWVSDENLAKFKENSEKLKPILIGQQAPPITFYNEAGEAVALYDIDSKYTIMIFWAPDCGHCKKAMPGLKELYAKYKPQGVEILGICTKHRDKYKTCWEYTKEKELPWITVGDEYHRSKFRDIYNVVSTPRVFILDAKKEILLKRVPTEQLDSVMEALIKEQEEKELKEQEEMKQK